VAVTLSLTLKSLQELWFEYKFGIDGRKPAEQFTTREKKESRRLKQMLHRRNDFWQYMVRFVLRGETVDTAIMRTQQCHGQQQSVTAIINKMIADGKKWRTPQSKIMPFTLRVIYS
jgi:hypothetical protein